MRLPYTQEELQDFTSLHQQKLGGGMLGNPINVLGHSGRNTMLIWAESFI